MVVNKCFEKACSKNIWYWGWISIGSYFSSLLSFVIVTIYQQGNVSKVLDFYTNHFPESFLVMFASPFITMTFVLGIGVVLFELFIRELLVRMARLKK
ncbi:MAG: hypothetical protein OCD01_05060 [Fibrobacterales bacterium]